MFVINSGCWLMMTGHSQQQQQQQWNNSQCIVLKMHIIYVLHLPKPKNTHIYNFYGSFVSLQQTTKQ